MDDVRTQPKIVPWVAVAALAGLTLGTQIWCLVVLFETFPADADYFLRPVDGLVARRHLIAAAAGVANIGVILATRRLQRGGGRCDSGLVLPVVAAGGFLGVLYATLTAPVYGANIGAGLILMAAPFVLGALLAWFASALYKNRRHVRSGALTGHETAPVHEPPSGTTHDSGKP
jgi:hypothetical protein